VIICRLCRKGPNEVHAVLQRVNEYGVAGIWECRPICGAQMSDDDGIVAAIEGVFDAPNEPTTMREASRTYACAEDIDKLLSTTLTPHEYLQRCPSTRDIQKVIEEHFGEKG
jgi:hypothetical protein